ncbi:hypothetical protein A2300_01415 [Candidatus Falkowbacteria bacterium RIFOXYB2_FULL_35_7]|nr:MAG: hypothetical protein A2300_01415 [Candidatus Falkowbacteria bacterium RIFOXYB2_FULL_35_7]
MAISLTGCISITKKGESTGTGLGMFVTGDRGETWIRKATLLTPGAQDANFSGASIFTLANDPTDADSIYAGTGQNGIYYSYNGGDGWTQAKSLLTKVSGRVLSIAVDPKDRCSIYAAVENKIVKSSDCNRSWEIMFTTATADELMRSIVVDWFDSKIVYALSYTGNVYKSLNNGISWAKTAGLATETKEMEMDPNDSRILYLATDKLGLFKSSDSGLNWISLRDNMKQFDGLIRTGYGIEIDKKHPNTVFYLSKFGLLKSGDGGSSWSQVKLVTAEDEVVFRDFEQSTVDPNVMFVTDDKTLYRSVDGGATWETKSLPSITRVGDTEINLKNDKILFVGFRPAS